MHQSIKYYTLVLVMLSAIAGLSQDTNYGVADAKNLYQQGKIYKALEIISPLLKDNKRIKQLNKVQRGELYRLSAHCYTLIDSPDSAANCVIQMLKEWPDYKEQRMRKADLERFRLALDTLYALPKFMIGVHMGVNYSFVNVAKEYSVVQTVQQPSIKYTGSLSYQFGLDLQYDFTNHLGIAAGVTYTRVSTHYERTSASSRFETNNLDFVQSAVYGQVEVNLHYRIPIATKSKLTIFGGANSAFMLNSKKKLSNDVTIDDSAYYRHELSAIQFGCSYLRRYYGYGLGVELKYIHYLPLVNEPDSRYSNDYTSSSLIYGNYYVPDDYYLGNLQLNFIFRYFVNYKVYSQKATKF